jgi:cell division protein FtsL
MIRTSSVLFWFSLIIIASLALYRTSDRVHELNTQLRQVNADIESEQQSIHVLKAEWVYLANPARVEAAAHKHLALRPTSPQQVTALNTLSEVLPTRSEAMASVAISGTPIANIRSNMEPMPTRPTTVAVAAKHAAPIAVASVDTGHINDRMIMQRTASAAPTSDSIGSLITELGANQ